MAFFIRTPKNLKVITQFTKNLSESSWAIVHGPITFALSTGMVKATSILTLGGSIKIPPTGYTESLNVCN